jgi:hypothetical protein
MSFNLNEIFNFFYDILKSDGKYIFFESSEPKLWNYKDVFKELERDDKFKVSKPIETFISESDVISCRKCENIVVMA